MKLMLLANIILCAGAMGGFLYGAIRFFRPKAAVYAQMVTFSCGVIVFGRMYQIIRLVTIGDRSEYFHLGTLAVIGSLMFLFAANFGLMDSLVDDGSKELRKYRIIPIAAPVLVLAVYLLLFFFTDQTLPEKIVSGVISIFIMQASYYNLKHLLVPDIDFGVIRSLRAYNLLALLYECLCLGERITMSRGLEVGTLIVCIAAGIVIPLIILSVDRGVRKWST